MAYNTMKPLYGSNRGFNYDEIATTTLVGNPIIFPDNISFVTWTLIIPDGIKAKLQATTISEDLITVNVTNLDKYWVDFDTSTDPAQDVNGFVTGPATIQGSIPVVNGLRLVRETATVDEVILGLRGQ
jgi:hypothetical protein